MDDIMAGLHAAQTAGFSPIKINMVVMPGVNDHEVEQMVEFCMERNLILRMIETMPVGHTGLGMGHTALDPIVDRLRERFELIPEIMELGGGPARYWRTADGRGQIGVITPMSQHFCATCNRVRLGVDGTLYLCLGQNDQVPLGRLLRAGASDTALRQAIHDAVARKPERHEFTSRPEQIVRFMAQTGG